MQGVDIRGVTDEQCKTLASFKHCKQIKIAWDNPREDIRYDLLTLLGHVEPYKVMCYVLIGYWSTEAEDLVRVEQLRRLKIDPFVMPYDKTDYYQRRFARWVNHKATFKTVAWKDYAA